MFASLKVLASRIRGWVSRQHDDQEFQQELSAHLEMLTNENIQRGMTPDEANRAARIRLGGLAQLHETNRELRGLPILENFLQDIRFAFRMLCKNPGFTAVAVLTLALGIGANTAIFSVLDSVLIRPLPFKDPSHLFLLTEYSPGKVEKTGAPYPRYLAWKTQNTSFEETAAYWQVSGWDGFVVGGIDSAERVRSTIVTNSFFSILGVTPAIGRSFLADEEKSHGTRVFLISNALWRRSFGASLDAIGKQFRLDGDIFTLVGVMPRDFQFPEKCDVWVPMSGLGDFGLTDRVSHQFWVLGRLRPGVTSRRAQEEMDEIEAQLGKLYPRTDQNWYVRVTPLLDEFVGAIRASLIVLLGAVIFVLLIACANVTNLLLARAVVREREFAIRMALGAGRARLLRQTLTESLFMTIISSAIGILLAIWGLRAILALSASSVPRMEQFHLNGPVLVFVSIVSVMVAVLVGTVPVFRSSGSNFQESLREGKRVGSASIRSRGLRGALVISEVTLTLLLLCGAGLMLKSFLQLGDVNPGFDPENLLTMQIALPDSEYPKTEQRTAFLNNLLQKLRALPGVSGVAAINPSPLSGDAGWGSVNIVGRPMLDWSHAPVVAGHTISAGYFRTMSIPMFRGRDFRASDAQDASEAVIINEAMAKRFWPDADPIGQQIISVAQQSRPRTIVGVVGNVKAFGLNAESEAEMYTLYSWWSGMTVVMRGTSNPAGMISAVRSEVAALDKDVPVYQVATMKSLLANSITPQRFNLLVMGAFAVLALILAGIGIYGFLAFGVSQQTHEIGVRMALGARPQQILSHIVGQGMKLVLIGALIGVAASVALTRLIASLLYRVSPGDPVILAIVATLLAAIAFIACYIPARRATRVSPVIALRHE